MRRLALIAALLSLTGCASNLDRLRDADPQANDFPSALAAEYLAFANSEAELGHHQSADYFAQKGLRAHKGEVVLPEAVDPNLPVVRQKELESARKQLMTMETDDVKRVSPQKLARAQLLFDCWQQQLNKGVNPEVAEALAPCADEFKSSMNELQPVANSFIYGAETTQYVQFATNSTELNQESLDVLQKIADRVNTGKKYTLTLTGIADHKHHILLQRRLRTVKETLVAKGVNAKNIRFKEPGSKAVLLSNDKVAANNDQITITIGQPRPHKK